LAEQAEKMPELKRVISMDALTEQQKESAEKAGLEVRIAVHTY
jgi:hypothetical protein